MKQCGRLLLVAVGVLALAGPAKAGVPTGIHQIRHVVIIMQENRSFDAYFGTYPGADGIPGLAGHPGEVPCIPDPNAGHCQRPYHDPTESNAGGPHLNEDALLAIDGGKMDGFIRSGRTSITRTRTAPPAR